MSNGEALSNAEGPANRPLTLEAREAPGPREVPKLLLVRDALALPLRACRGYRWFR